MTAGFYKVSTKNKCLGCKQQGLCCCLTVKESGIIYVLPSHPCKYLGPDKLCTIYETRHEVFPLCATIEKVSKCGGVPPKCNYKDDYDFPVKVRIASPKNQKRLVKKFHLHGVYPPFD